MDNRKHPIACEHRRKRLTGNRRNGEGAFQETKLKKRRNANK